MGNRSTVIGIWAASLFMLLLLAGCSGGSMQRSGDPAAIDAALEELGSADAPQGVDSATWQALADELAKSLELKAQGKLSSAASSQCGVELSDGKLQWIHDLRGDYDNNGSVTIADLTPLAQHLSESAVGAEVGSMLWRIDGNLDGEINIGDVTPIGANFAESVSGYGLLHSATAGGSETLVESFPIPEQSLGLASPAAIFNTSLSLVGYFSLAVLDSRGAVGESIETVFLPELPEQGSIAGMVTDISGSALAAVSVSLPGHGSATSDTSGAFSFSSVTPGEYLLSFSAAGYTDGYAKLSVAADEESTLTVSLLERSVGGTIDASAGGTFTAPDGAFFSIPANALVDSSGAPLSGELNLWLTTVDFSSAAQSQALPGGSTVIEESGEVPALAALEIYIDDKIGGHAQLSAGKSAEIGLSHSAGGSAPSGAALYTIDTATGEWHADGELTSSEGIYSGSISHLSWFGGFGPKAQSEDPEVLVVRDDGGVFDANYNAIIADLDELGVNYTEVNFDSEVVDTYFEGEYLAAIWYRGGQGDSLEPAQSSYPWASADYQLMFDIMDGGGNVVLFSQQHSSYRSNLGHPQEGSGFNDWWQNTYDFSSAPEINVDLDFCEEEGQHDGWYLPWYPLLANPITILPNTTLAASYSLTAGSYSVDTAELHSANGGSGLTPLELDLPATMPFIARATQLSFPNMSPTMSGGFAFEGSDGSASLSYGNSAAPGAEGTGAGRYYCIGYAWNQISVNSAEDAGQSPASMERWDLLRNVLSWLDNGISF